MATENFSIQESQEQPASGPNISIEQDMSMFTMAASYPKFDLKELGFADLELTDTAKAGGRPDQNIGNANDTQFVAGADLAAILGGNDAAKANLAFNINADRLKPGLRQAVAGMTDNDADAVRTAIANKHDLSTTKGANDYWDALNGIERRDPTAAASLYRSKAAIINLLRRDEIK